MAEQQISFEQFIEGLPAERRETVREVWQIIRENIPADYREEITPGFLTFKANDIGYVSLASQKNYLSLYLTPLYLYPELKDKLNASGKKIKGGKTCINFKETGDLPLEIGEIVASKSAKEFEKHYRQWQDECRTKK